MFRDFRASKGKLFLWTISFFGVFLLFHWMGIDVFAIPFLVISGIYGSVWFYKVRRDLSAGKQSPARREPSLQPLPLASKQSPNVNGLKVPHSSPTDYV